eukprot:11499891-Ditylum_brightwellii.AAC.1
MGLIWKISSVDFVPHQQIKEVATHCTTKAAKTTEEIVYPTDTNDTKMTNDNDEIDTIMADDTAMMLILQSADKNDKGEWMDAGKKDICGGPYKT